MVYSLRFKVDTWLKQTMTQGADLPDDQRQFINARTVLPITNVQREGTHLKLGLGQDEQGNPIQFKGRRNWYVYEPAVEVLRDGQVVTVDAPGFGEPVFTLRVDLDTWLKQNTDQSSDLSDDQKQFISAGSVLPLSSVAPAGRYHLTVALGKDAQGNQVRFKGRNTWYAYRPTVEVLRNGEVFDIPVPPQPSPAYSVKFLLDTWLKQSTVQGSSLPEEQRQFIDAGTILPIADFKPIGNYHLLITFGLDERGKQISFKGRNTWYVYLPTAQVLRDGEAIDLFPPALGDTDSDYLLQIKLDTYLKLRPIQSSELPDNQRYFINAGRTLPLASFTLDGDHLKVSFGKDSLGNQIHFQGRNTWYVYESAVQLFRDGEPVDLTPPPAANNGKINEQGLRLLKNFEGLRLRAYLDPVGVWTIGYGTTSGVRPGMTITVQQAEELLKRDLIRFENIVDRYVKVPLNSNQFSALVSFVYNVGAGAFSGSTLLRLLNQNNYRGAADQLLRWVNAGGRSLPGLVRRRRAERALFLGQDFSQFL